MQEAGRGARAGLAKHWSSGRSDVPAMRAKAPDRTQNPLIDYREGHPRASMVGAKDRSHNWLPLYQSRWYVDYQKQRLFWRRHLILDDVVADVSRQLGDQAELGIQVTRQSQIPERGPSNRGVWLQIPQVTAVFADLKSSTELSSTASPRVVAVAYTYFIRAMAVTLERFSAGYVDIQGDGIFGLFSGQGSAYMAAACGITMKTLVEREVSIRFQKDVRTDWKLSAGIGIDQGTLLVRRLGLRGTKQNEVWAGKPVNVAAKLSTLAEANEIVVADRVFALYEHASRLRQRTLMWSCGCDGGVRGAGFDAPIGHTSYLWQQELVPGELGMDFPSIYRLRSLWCVTHGTEFCEAIASGRRPSE